MASDSKYLFMVMADIDPEHEAAFNQCYNEEYIPNFLEVPGFHGATRYEMAPRIRPGKAPPPPFPKYVAVFELESPDVLDTKVFYDAGDKGSWNSKIKPHVKNASHLMCKRVFPETRKPVQAKYLVLAMANMDPDWEEKFNKDYDAVMIPSMLTVPGILGVERYVMTHRPTPGPGAAPEALALPKYLAIFQMDGPDVNKGEAFRNATAKPDWFANIEPHYSSGAEVLLTKIYP